MQTNTVKIEGLGDVTKVLNDIDKKVNNTAPLMAEIANHLVNVVEESWEHERTPEGIAWSPIKPRANDPHPEKILYAEGHMQRSLYDESDATSAEVGVNATADGFPYPIAHQFGTEDGRLDARAFVPIDENGNLYSKTDMEIIEILEGFLLSV